MKTEINQLMHEKNLDAIIISGSGSQNPPMAYFFSGAFFTRAHLFIIRDEDPVLFYRPMERDTAAQTGLSRIISYDTFPAAEFRAAANGDPVLHDALELRALCQSLGLQKGRVAFCGQVRKGSRSSVRRAIPKTPLSWKKSGGWGRSSPTSSGKLKRLSAAAICGTIACLTARINRSRSAGLKSTSIYGCAN